MSADIEMGPVFVSDLQPLIEEEVEEKVQTAFGHIKVTIYGDRTKRAIITYHDIGLDGENSFQNFFMFGSSVAEFTKKFCIYNINAPGQEVDANRLSDNFIYPSMEGLAKTIDSVVDHFRIKTFIGFGVGAGANILMRYALENQDKVDALVLINCTVRVAGWIEWGYQKLNVGYLRSRGMTSFTVDYMMWHHFGKHIDQCNPDIVRQYRSHFMHIPHPSNLAAFIESYMNRTAIDLTRDSTIIGRQLRVPVLQIVGATSAFIDETVDVMSKLDPSTSNWMKVSDACGLVLDDRPEKVTEAVFLFLQGLGYFPSVNLAKLMQQLSINQSTSNDQQFESIVRSTSDEDDVGPEPVRT